MAWADNCRNGVHACVWMQAADESLAKFAASKQALERSLDEALQRAARAEEGLRQQVGSPTQRHAHCHLEAQYVSSLCLLCATCQGGMFEMLRLKLLLSAFLHVP